MKHVDHCRFSKLICRECIEEVDKLIDSGPFSKRPRRPMSAEERIQRYRRGLELGGAVNVDISQQGMHDDIKTNVCALIELAKKIYGKYGDKGLCVIALHVLLDKVSSVMRGVVIAQRPVIVTESLTEGAFLDLVYKHLGAEISSFTVLKYWDSLREETALGVVYSIMKESGAFIRRSTQRNKRKLIEAIYMNADPQCVEANKDLVEKLIIAYNNAYRGLREYWKDVCCTAKTSIRDPFIKQALSKVLSCEG